MSPSVRDSLLVHADFVRRLAARLAGADGRVDGDDLAQDTWANAFAAARAPDEPRGWLATIANNLARNVRRAAGRRERREATREAPSAGPSVAEILQREEVRQRVVAAVVALPERLREVVLLHFYEGLDSSAIGRRLGAPASTVRSRLQQALVQLRQQLDREHGDRRAWSVPLGGWLLPTQALRVAFGVRAALALGAVLLLALLTAPWWWGGAPAPVSPIVGESTIVASAEPSREPAAEQREVAREPAVAAVEDAHGPEDLWGRVVAAADGSPVVGAEVVVEHRPGDEFRHYDDAYRERAQPVATMFTDGDGRFRCKVRRDLKHRLRVTANGFAPLHRVYCSGGAVLELGLERPAYVDGFVRRTDGTPLDGALVEVVLRGSLPGAAIGARTGVDGAFFVGGLPPGVSYVRVQPDGLLPPSWQTVELVAGGSAHCEFTVSAGRTLHGVVRDAATKLPVVGATIVAEDAAASSGDDGAFELTGLSRSVVLTVHAARYGRVKVPVAGTATEVLVDLPPGLAVRGRIVDRQGAPIGGAYVAVATTLPLQGHEVHWIAATTAGDGTFSLTELAARAQRADGVSVPLRWQMTVRADGYGSRSLAVPDFTEREDLGDIALDPAGALELRVVDESGQPQVELDVSLIGSGGDYGELLGEGDPSQDEYHFLSRSSARTGEDGRCYFAGLGSGDYLVAVSVSGSSQVTSGPHAVVTAQRLVADDIVVRRGMSIAGKVVLPSGLSAAEVQQLHVVAWPTGEHGTISTALRADGSFELERLERDRYTLMVVERVAGHAMLPVPDVQAGARDVLLRLVPALTIQGRVVDKRGEPVPRATVAFFAEGQPSARNDRCDDQGRFVIEVAPGATGKLSAMHPDDQMTQGSVGDLVAGQRDVLVELRQFGDPR
ncbi:MAG: sigma-70 family RNA polymerase sigma factor [Planctomycetota bacterium]